MADQSISRREMLGLLGSGLVVVTGFDPTSRRWLSQVEAAACPTFVDAPPLDGVLLLDDAARGRRTRATRATSSFTRRARCSGPARWKTSSG